MNVQETLEYMQKLYPEITEEDIMMAKTLNGSLSILANAPKTFILELIFTLRQSNFSLDDFRKYCKETTFYVPSDIIFSLPVFEEQKKEFELKVENEAAIVQVEDSLYRCRKCSKPAFSTQKQTRSSDEGVSVFVHCQYCNITYQV